MPLYKCTNCSGVGNVKCQLCCGNGYINKEHDDNFVVESNVCYSCTDGNVKCSTCSGNGYIVIPSEYTPLNIYNQTPFLTTTITPNASSSTYLSISSGITSKQPLKTITSCNTVNGINNIKYPQCQQCNDKKRHLCNEHVVQHYKCLNCHGTGKVVITRDCDYCRGTGCKYRCCHGIRTITVDKTFLCVPYTTSHKIECDGCNSCLYCDHSFGLCTDTTPCNICSGTGKTEQYCQNCKSINQNVKYLVLCDRCNH